jgi:hypothetical protein
VTPEGRTDSERLDWVAENLNHLVKRKGGWVSILHPSRVYPTLQALADAAMNAEEERDG